MLLMAPNGATVDAGPAHAALLLRDGWRPVGAEPERPADVGGLTVAQLRALCVQRGIKAPTRATKAQLVMLLEA